MNKELFLKLNLFKAIIENREGLVCGSNGYYTRYDGVITSVWFFTYEFKAGYEKKFNVDDDHVKKYYLNEDDLNILMSIKGINELAGFASNDFS